MAIDMLPVRLHARLKSDAKPVRMSPGNKHVRQKNYTQAYVIIYIM